VPKISGLINEHERQIAGRIRRVREAAFLSQPEFAKALDETLNRIASLEYGRTPLTVSVADKIADSFGVNLHWLKTGEGKMKSSIGLFSVFCPEIKGSTLLSKASTVSLKDKSAAALTNNYAAIEAFLYKKIVLPKGKEQKHFVEGFHRSFDEDLNLLPHEGREKLLALLLLTKSQFTHDWFNGEKETPGQNVSMKPLTIPPGKTFDLFDLTDKATHAKSEGVQNQWDRLKQRIQKVTKSPGGKSTLAKFLGVDLTQLSKWLTDSKKSAREPGADYTLKMLQWVQEHESK
jgi:transcriptional regulator with XRE-family HTH domain